MKRKSILVKTFINLFGVMLFLVLAVHMSIFFIYKNFYVSNCTKQMAMTSEYVVSILKNTENYGKILASYAKTSNMNICVRRNGQTQFYHGNSFYLDFYSHKDELVYIRGIDGMDAVLFKTRTVALKDGTEADVQLSMNLRHFRESRGIAISLLPYSLLISLGISVAFSYFYSKKITNPIVMMSSTVKGMTDLDSEAEIRISNDDELGTLASNINDLYKNLLKVIEDYKEKNEEVMHLEHKRLDFFRGTSHELKTPLARLLVLQESMRYNIGKYRDRDKYLDESIKMIRELSQMITGTLDGMKNINTAREEIKPIHVRECLEKIVDNYQIIARSRGMMIQVDIIGDMKLPISRAELERVLSNVISNAIQHSICKGEVSIELGDTELDIYNESEPIPEATMKTIWKGKYILGKSYSSQSSGLGLYIVKTILDQYGIRFCFFPYKDGYLFKIVDSSAPRRT